MGSTAVAEAPRWDYIVGTLPVRSGRGILSRVAWRCALRDSSTAATVAAAGGRGENRCGGNRETRGNEEKLVCPFRE